MVSYSDVATLEFDFNAYTNAPDVMSAIDALALSSSSFSDYQQALNVISSQLSATPPRRFNVPGWILFFADQPTRFQDSTSINNIMATVSQLKQFGFTIETIGLSNSCPNNLLYDMSSSSKYSSSKLYYCTSYTLPDTQAEAIFFNECKYLKNIISFMLK